MRNLTPALRSEISKRVGLDVTLIVGVKWSDDQEVFYGSHEREGVNHSLVSLTELDTTQSIGGSGASQTAQVVLSDTDGQLRKVIDSVDIHKRPAKVYLSLPGVGLESSMVLIDGEINSDIEWSDAARTLSFSILSKIEGRQFGFAAEDGLFHEVDQKERTTPWPFRFGETCAYPTVSVRNGVQGLLRIGQGVGDPTLEAQICQAGKVNCPFVEAPGQTNFGLPVGVKIMQYIDVFNGSIIAERRSDDPFKDFEGPAGFYILREKPEGDEPTPLGLFEIRVAASNQGTTPAETGNSPRFGGFLAKSDADRAILRGDGRIFIPDNSCEKTKSDALCQALRDKANQALFIADTLSISGGGKFPQNEIIELVIGDVIYSGIMVGETFTIRNTIRQDVPVNPTCEDFNRTYLGYKADPPLLPTNLAECSNPSTTVSLRIVGGAADAFRNLDKFKSAPFIWLPSGTEVFLRLSSVAVNVVSVVPGTVVAVQAYRKFGDVSILTTLPTNYYTVVNTNYGGFTATEVHIERALSSYTDENWDDQLYVTFDSSVGPNPVDVLEWIIPRYTDFTFDPVSFAAVKLLLANYPCNFVHSKKSNVIQVMAKIAYEARCALTITDNVVKLTYLPKEPESLRTLAASSVVAGSFRFRHTRTESLKTSSDITWSPRGASAISGQRPERSFTVERNVAKYGFFGSTETYETITNEPQALKTATFWSIRDSNTWRLVEFATGLENLDLEVFDCVTLSIAPFPTVKVVIDSVKFDPGTNTVKFTAWTPILSGTTEPYFFAWPATKPINVPYPENNFDLALPPISVTPPITSPLYISNPNQPVPSTTGDRFPSDIADGFPVTNCDDPGDPDLVDLIAPQFESRSLGLQAQADRVEALQNNDPTTGGGASLQEDDENEVCGRPSLETCVFTVEVYTGTAVLIYDGPGPCKQTGRGAFCAGPSVRRCRTFGSYNFAKLFYDMTKAGIEENLHNWTVGKSGPVGVTGPYSHRVDDCIGIDAELLPPSENFGVTEEVSPFDILD